MPKPEMKDTAVTKWLETNLAEPEIVKAFYDADLFEVTEVHDEDIDALVGKDKRGLVNRLKGSLKEQNKPKPEPEPKEKLKPTPPPNLPAGQTFDLSAPSLTYKDVEFKIPASLPVSVDGKPTMPADLNSGQRSETADGVARESEGRTRLPLLRPLRQDQPRRHSGARLRSVSLQQGRAGRGPPGLRGRRGVLGSSDGWANWRLRSGRRLTDRIEAVQFAVAVDQRCGRRPHGSGKR